MDSCYAMLIPATSTTMYQEGTIDMILVGHKCQQLPASCTYVFYLMAMSGCSCSLTQLHFGPETLHIQYRGLHEPFVSKPSHLSRVSSGFVHRFYTLGCSNLARKRNPNPMMPSESIREASMAVVLLSASGTWVNLPKTDCGSFSVSI